ncbi:hypothetical protein ASE98_20560 [Pseudomonas sp. Leaf48]|nr:hypothetical protein ASE98_20560 [Pseudomonas sp. Leaf48]
MTSSLSGSCRSEFAPGGVPTMDDNDNAGILNARGALRFFASRLAPTGFALSLRGCVATPLL